MDKNSQNICKASSGSEDSRLYKSCPQKKYGTTMGIEFLFMQEKRGLKSLPKLAQKEGCQ